MSLELNAHGSQLTGLLPDCQTFDEIRVALRVFGLEIVEQAAPLADKHQQTTARVVILCVRLEVLRQVVDAFAENRDLDFRGSGVGVVGSITAYQLCFAIFGQRHLGSSTCAPEPAGWSRRTGCAVC